MASFSDKVKVLIDVDSTGAVSGLAKFKDEFKKAEGAADKFKTVTGAGFDFIKANAGAMALSAGAAITAFVGKAVGEFQDLALSVDKFRDATGLTLDQASRWTEVAGDIGIDAGTIETAINKMNKKVGDSPQLFHDLGIEMAKHKDGTYDPQGTFLNVIDALKNIKDPAEKATTATAILGKGWTSLADLIEKGSGRLTDSLNSVSDAKVIDESEVKKAENYRDAMDKLSDAFDDFMNTVGEKFMPILAAALSALAKALGPIGDVVEAIAGPQDSITKTVLDMGATWDSVVKKMGFEQVMSDMGLSASELATLIEDKTLVPAIYEMRDAWVEGYRSMIDARTKSDDLAESLRNQDDDLNGLIDSWDVFLGKLDEEEAWDNVQKQIDDYNTAAFTAFAENTPEAWAKADEARVTAQKGIAEYIRKLGDIKPEIQSKILALVEMGKIDEAERILAQLARQREVEVLVKVRREEIGSSGNRELGAPPVGFVDTPFGRFVPDGNGGWKFATAGRALGGPVAANTPYIVGERGPELFVPNQSGRINPSTGGITINVAGSVVTERDLIETVRRGLVNAQRSGRGLVYTNT